MKKLLLKNYIFIIVVAFIMSFSIGYFTTNNGLNEEASAGDTIISAANYDKMKIAEILIKEKVTGTKKFNTPDYNSVDDGSILSDMEGHDVSEKDNYVRTFDSVRYKVEVAIALNLDNPNVTTTTQLTGGVVKVKATLPVGADGTTYFYWNQETWMSNYNVSSDGRVLTATYRFPDSETAVGGNQQLTFVISTGGNAGELPAGQVPTFEIWMEGNQPDNANSLAPSKTIADDEPLKVTGVPAYDIQVVSPRINTPSVRNGVNGQYINFGIALHIIGDEVFGAKGRAMPTARDTATANLKLTYKYRNGHAMSYDTYTTLDGTGERGWLNGTELIAFNKASSMYENPNAWPNSTSNYLGPCSSGYNGNGIGYRVYCGADYYGYYGYDHGYDSGDVDVQFVLNEMFVSNTNVKNTVHYDSSIYSMVYSDAIEVFVPYIDDTSDHDYQLVVQITDYTLCNENLMADDYVTSNNSQAIEFKDYLTGNIYPYLNST